MVKNTGGNKSKKLGRKYINIPTQKAVRLSKQEDEKYAVVTKLYGGANCEVLCEDNVTRMCVIRNKFRGRSKRDNWLSIGVWVLIGLRSWETSNTETEIDIGKLKLDKCDLLEVYSTTDKESLKSNKTLNVKVLCSVGNQLGEDNEEEDYFEYNTKIDRNSKKQSDPDEEYCRDTYLRPNPYLSMVIDIEDDDNTNKNKIFNKKLNNIREEETETETETETDSDELDIDNI